MAVKVAINGFGRIGRLVLRAIVESRDNPSHLEMSHAPRRSIAALTTASGVMPKCWKTAL